MDDLNIANARLTTITDHLDAWLRDCSDPLAAPLRELLAADIHLRTATIHFLQTPEHKPCAQAIDEARRLTGDVILSCARLIGQTENNANS